MLCIFVCFDFLCPSQHFFSLVGTGLPGLNQRRKCLAQGHNVVPPLRVQTHNSLIVSHLFSTLPLSHCAPHMVDTEDSHEVLMRICADKI